MEMGLVSIIMPSYNTESFIKETIMSVLNQTYTNWELIIIDDCSTDRTDDIVAEFKDKRIEFYKNESNQGAAVSRNRALKLAKGEWIAFLDSDDIWHPEKLNKQLEFMNERNIVFSYTNYHEIDEQSKSLGRNITGPKKITKALMYAYCWVGCLSVMYSAKELGIVQISDLKKNNDYAIWLKVIKKANCYLLEEDLAGYRRRKGSISSQNKLKLIEHHYILFRSGENFNIFISLMLTFGNLFFGSYKKLRYVKGVNNK